MTNDRKLSLFENAPVAKAVLLLSAPTVASCLVSILYSLADTYFVGMLNADGGCNLGCPGAFGI